MWVPGTLCNSVKENVCETLGAVGANSATWRCRMPLSNQRKYSRLARAPAGKFSHLPVVQHLYKGRSWIHGTCICRICDLSDKFFSHPVITKCGCKSGISLVSILALIYSHGWVEVKYCKWQFPYQLFGFNSLGWVLVVRQANIVFCCGQWTGWWDCSVPRIILSPLYRFCEFTIVAYAIVLLLIFGVLCPATSPAI